jgi:hypothetical protein
MKISDSIIVSSSLKRQESGENAIDPNRVSRFVEMVQWKFKGQSPNVMIKGIHCYKFRRVL